jgi:NTE family protein/lysophospholipid hydrolase
MPELLEALPFFRALDDAQVQLLNTSAERVQLAPGAILFRQGDAGDAIYIVVSGALDVVLASPSGDQWLARLEPGDLVGELAVLYRRPRTATVRAVADATLLKIDVDALERVFAADPSTRTAFLQATSRRLAVLSLASVPMFAGLGSEVLRELDRDANWVRLAGGETLFAEGDRPDYLYVVVRGRLEVVRNDGAGRTELIDRLGQGAVVGEVALLSGEPRTATVRAVRDSELIRLSKDALFRLLEQHPSAAIEILRILARRIRPVPSARSQAPVATIAVVPVGRLPLPGGCIDRLVDFLTTIGGATLHVSSARVADALGAPGATLDDDLFRLRVATWLREQEDRFRYVVSECDARRSPWTELCLRQADLVVYVASADDERSPDAREHADIVARATPRELVLLHAPNTSRPVGTSRWLAAFPVTRHHHVRLHRDEDYARVARFIAGRAVGLAVSGGGARAFAHVGVIRALRESGVPIDAVGGVSAGAFPLAFYAIDDDPERVAARSLEHIGNYSIARDATLPMAAFVSGRGMVRAVRQMYGDIDIEDLWHPFFCVSSNLTTAQVKVHDAGPLWLAMRATTSVPGVAPPVCMGGELLVDGGVLNNLPADVMRRRVGTVIASDVSLPVDLTSTAGETVSLSGWSLLASRLGPAAARRSYPHIFEILTRTATLSSIHHGASVARNADLYLWTSTEGIATFDWAAGTTLIERGYRQALVEIEKWKTTERAPE